MGPMIERAARAIGATVFYSADSLRGELRATRYMLTHRYDLYHVLYVENSLGLVRHLKPYLRHKIVGTVHQPYNWWRTSHADLGCLACLDAVIGVASNQVAELGQHCDPARIHFVPHGVDVEFFCPMDGDAQKREQGREFRCIFSGFWQRDVVTLARVLDRLADEAPWITCDCLVPTHKRKDPVFAKLSECRTVRWQAGLSDLQLRTLYRSSGALLLPLTDCTANNAILEAMACGLPVITNRVGGIPDYCDESFADMLPVGDVDGMVDAVIRLAEDADGHRRRSVEARKKAVSRFAWEVIAAKTMTVYGEVAGWGT